MNFVGIDPDSKGAVSHIGEDGSFQYSEKNEFITWPLVLKGLKDNKDDYKIYIEKQWGRPVSGAAASFSLGFNYGKWLTILDLASVSYQTIPPQTWQQKILNTSKKKAKETKPLAMEYVRHRYPLLNVPNTKRPKDIAEWSGICDSICIALYGRFLTLNLL